MLRILLPFVCIAALAAPPALAQDAPPGSGRADRGWHFYDDPPPAKPKPKPKAPQPQPAPATTPAPLSAQWLRENMDTYRDRAIDSPTRENVELYAYMQRLAMDKAERFADMMEVVSTEPALDEKARSPITAYQLEASRGVQNEAEQRVIARLNAEGIGIWYFFRSDCPYCAKQDPVLERFTAQSGMTILPVSVDGLPLVSGAFPNFVPDAGQAARMQVNVTPTLVLANPRTGEMVKFSEGLKTQDEIQDRILLTAHDHGWISDTEYDDATRGMPKRYLTDGMDPQQLAALKNSPEALLAFLRAAGDIGRGTPIQPSASGAQ